DGCGAPHWRRDRRRRLALVGADGGSGAPAGEEPGFELRVLEEQERARDLRRMPGDEDRAATGARARWMVSEGGEQPFVKVRRGVDGTA
ncbi:MAG: hypothetical protein M3P39_02375, partial [Actinomycetota bacterium]|nr:hypothetical protein [Actinomycetota bacterium]